MCIGTFFSFVNFMKVFFPFLLTKLSGSSFSGKNKKERLVPNFLLFAILFGNEMKDHYNSSSVDWKSYTKNLYIDTTLQLAWIYGYGIIGDFNKAINKVFEEMSKIRKNWKNKNVARFVCCLTLFWPDGNNCSGKGIVEGKISTKKKGNKGFGYDPIFIPDGYNETFGEMEPKLKMSIDHRFKAYSKIRKFFNYIP